MQQITVSRVNLDEIKASLKSSARGLAKAFNDCLDSRQIELSRHSIVRRKCDCAGRKRLPAAFSGCYQHRSRLERRSRTALASGVRQLHTRSRALRMQKLRYTAQVWDVLVLPNAKIGGRNAAFRQNCRSLKHHQPSTSLRAATQVHQVPVIGKAVLAGVLAHGRNADAIAEF